MTKKDYEKIASVIGGVAAKYDETSASPITDVLDRIVEDLCAIFASDNPRFDRDKFIAACEPRESRL
jgi:hypothetical protein